MIETEKPAAGTKRKSVSREEASGGRESTQPHSSTHLLQQSQSTAATSAPRDSSAHKKLSKKKRKKREQRKEMQEEREGENDVEACPEERGAATRDGPARDAGCLQGGTLPMAATTTAVATDSAGQTVGAELPARRNADVRAGDLKVWDPVLGM